MFVLMNMISDIHIDMVNGQKNCYITLVYQLI